MPSFGAIAERSWITESVPIADHHSRVGQDLAGLKGNACASKFDNTESPGANPVSCGGERLQRVIQRDTAI